MLDLRRLQVLAAVDRYGTMTAAAAHLHMTTSSVSQQVALLEREVGLPLLDRMGRTVRLNQAGTTLVEHFGRIAQAVEQAESSLAHFRTGVEGSVRVCTFPSFASTVLPRALMVLREKYPLLQPTVQDMEPHESLALLRNGEVDVAVVDSFQDLPGEGILAVPLVSDELVLCLPPGTEPLPPDPSPLSLFANRPWLMDTEGTVFERFTMAACRRSGFEPRVVANCGNLTATLGLVRAGFGVALMSSLNLGRPTEGLVVRRVDPLLQRELRILVREASKGSPVVVAVVDELERAARGHHQAQQAGSTVCPSDGEHPGH